LPRGNIVASDIKTSARNQRQRWLELKLWLMLADHCLRLYYGMGTIALSEAPSRVREGAIATNEGELPRESFTGDRAGTGRWLIGANRLGRSNDKSEHGEREVPMCEAWWGSKQSLGRGRCARGRGPQPYKPHTKPTNLTPHNHRRANRICYSIYSISLYIVFQNRNTKTTTKCVPSPEVVSSSTMINLNSVSLDFVKLNLIIGLLWEFFLVNLDFYFGYYR
jgi:hypothetical protein